MEYPKFYNETMPIARKQHTCCECRGAIQSGEHYHKVTGKWDDRIGTFKTCTDCELIKKSAFAYVDRYDEGIAFEELGQWLIDADLDELSLQFNEVKRKRKQSK